MSRDKLIILGVVLLGVLGFVTYKYQQQDAAIGHEVATSKDLPTISAPDDVDKISITNGEKAEVVLERVPDPKGTAVDGGPPMKWEMTKPIHAQATCATSGTKASSEPRSWPVIGTWRSS